ncbi:hypothetical protein F4819DRAFT_492526 [Hypoxylon fuscum]|nr:hypothetical protein F4819DRAFT_492526 [Hypoxylon fuscum]
MSAEDRERIEQIESRLDTLETQILTTEHWISSIEDKIQEMEDMGTTDRVLAVEQNRLRDVKERLDSLERERDVLQSELADLKAKTGISNSPIPTERTRLLSSLKAPALRVRYPVQTLKMSNTGRRAEINRRLKELEEAIDGARMYVQRMRDNLRTVEAMTDATQSLIDYNRNRLRQAEERVAAKEAEKSRLQAELNRL